MKSEDQGAHSSAVPAAGSAAQSGETGLDYENVLHQAMTDAAIEAPELLMIFAAYKRELSLFARAIELAAYEHAGRRRASADAADAPLRARIERLEAAIADEPDLPGPMPDEMWNAIRGDRDAVERVLRIAVQKTKEGIRARAALGEGP